MSHVAWLEQAEDDLKAARVLSAQAHHSQAIWLASQAVEKAHKAIFVALGLRYEDKHFKQLGHATSDIAKLLPEALHEPPDPAIATMVATLETLGRAVRYPMLVQVPLAPAQIIAPAKHLQSSQKELQDAAALVQWCQDRIGRALRAVNQMRP